MKNRAEGIWDVSKHANTGRVGYSMLAEYCWAELHTELDEFLDFKGKSRKSNGYFSAV